MAKHDVMSMLGKALGEAVQAVEDLPLPEFCQRRLWVRDKESGVVPFELFPIQKLYLEKKRQALAQGKPAKFILLKYRRGGFTTLEQAASYKMCVTQRRVVCATLAHTRPSTDKISQIAKTFRELDPQIPDKDEKNEKISLDFAHTRSSFTIGTAGGTAFGRGDTLQRVHGSEVAFWCEGPNQHDDVEKLVAGLTEAASKGEVVLESTPNGVNWFCNTFKLAVQGLNDWTPIFLPWFLDLNNVAPEGTFDYQEVLETITSEEGELVRKHELKVPQIAWRRQKILALGRLFKQEYPEDPDTCFLTTGILFFDFDAVARLIEGLDASLIPLRPKMREDKVPGGKITIIEPPEKDEKYVIGADCSEGLPTSDPCFAGVLRKRDNAQVAWIHGRFRPEVFAKHLTDLGNKYNEAFLGIERNNHGHSVLNTVQNVIGYRNVFYCKNDKGEPGPSISGSGKSGWETTAVTRPIMLDELEQALREDGMKIRCGPFLSECLSFKLQADGKYEADPGAHDDTVMGWAIANQMRKYERHRARVIVLD